MLAAPATGGPLRIGHRGAAALAPENTLESLAGGGRGGGRRVEFDVLDHARDGLVLAHSRRETGERPLPFDDALAWLAETGRGVHVDLKGVGFEDRVVDALQRHGVAARSLVSTARAPSVRRLAELAPELPRALAYPEDRLGVARLAARRAVRRRRARGDAPRAAGPDRRHAAPVAGDGRVAPRGAPDTDPRREGAGGGQRFTAVTYAPFNRNPSLRLTEVGRLARPARWSAA